MLLIEERMEEVGARGRNGKTWRRTPNLSSQILAVDVSRVKLNAEKGLFSSIFLVRVRKAWRRCSPRFAVPSLDECDLYRSICYAWRRVSKQPVISHPSDRRFDGCEEPVRVAGSGLSGAMIRCQGHQHPPYPCTMILFLHLYRGHGLLPRRYSSLSSHWATSLSKSKRPIADSMSTSP